MGRVKSNIPLSEARNAKKEIEMAKWVKCNNCGKSFGKTDIRNGICVICSDGDESVEKAPEPAAAGDDERQAPSDSGYILSSATNSQTQSQGNATPFDSNDKQSADLAGKTPKKNNYKAGSSWASEPSQVRNKVRYFASSSAGAIDFLETVNLIVLLLGLLAGFLVFVVGMIGDGFGFMSFLIGLAIAFSAAVGWSITRVFIGIAQDVRVSRDTNEALLKLAKKAISEKP